MKPGALVLVLNDDPDVVEALAAVLESDGYRVERRATRSVKDVLVVKPDLIMIDCPPGGEREVLNFMQLVRLDRTIAKIPVILGTSSLRHIEREILQGQSIQVLIRPFDVDSMLEVVREMLATSRPSQ